MARHAATRLLCLLTLVAIAPRTSHAEPIKTWGGEAPKDAPASEPNVPAPPPAPPPATIGTPIDEPPGPPIAPPVTPPAIPEDPAAATTGVVRAPGRVGLRYTLEGIQVRGNTSTLARVVLRYVPLKAGDTLDVDDKELELTRFRLLGTGYFRDVRLSLRRGTRRGFVVLVVSVVERNTIVVNDVWLGLSADADPSGAARPLTAYGGIDIAETNLAGSGISLGGAVALADRQIGLRTRFADPQFLGSQWTAEAVLLYNHARDFFGNKDVLVDDPRQQISQDYAVLQYQRFGGMVGAGHDLGVSTQLFFDYRLEKLDASLPLAASHHRGLDVEPIDFLMAPGTTLLSTVRATLIHDTRDEPVLPTRGDHLYLYADAALAPLGSDYSYVKLHARASHWLPVKWGHVLRLEGNAGAVFGNAPLFEKFYVGDYSDLLPDRVLDLNFDRRTSPNFLGTDIVEVRYGQYAAKAAVEYRIPLYRGTRSVYGVDVFTSAGFFAIADGRDLSQHPRGYTGFATIPMDFTFNLGLKIDTQAGAFTLGLSNLLGFVPVRGNP
jgi:outer membrane protein insertion porin family